MPKLSVVMSVNGFDEHLVRSNVLWVSVRSVLDQTFKDFEFIIVCDGLIYGSGISLDLESYAQKDPRIKLILRKENRGLTYSLIEAIRNSTGEYIARQDADDYSHRERFQKQIEVLNSRSHVGLVGCSFYSFEEAVSNVLKRFDYKQSQFKGDMYDCLLTNNFFAHGSLMFRRSAYEDAGGYSPSFTYSQDYEFLLRMLNRCCGYYINEPLYYLRKHRDSLSRKHGLDQKRCKNIALELNEIRSRRGQVRIIQALRNYIVSSIKKTHMIISANFNCLGGSFVGILLSLLKMKETDLYRFAHGCFPMADITLPTSYTERKESIYNCVFTLFGAFMCVVVIVAICGCIIAIR